MKTSQHKRGGTQPRRQAQGHKRRTLREKQRTQARQRRRLATIWRVPNEMWEMARTILPPEKPAGTVGRPIVPYRTVLNGILHVLRSGCQWKVVPQEFGSGSTCHLRFQEWVASGVFAQLWECLLLRYDELRGIQWTWQAADSKSVPAPLGGADTGPNPTDRGKLGSKRHQVVDGRGAPLSAVVTSANATDMKTNPAVLDGIAVERPYPTPQQPQHLCEDKGYDYPECRQQALERGYLPHIPRKGTDASVIPDGEKRHPARRWVVERTQAWQNKFRKLRVRWEKKTENWEGLWHLANCLIIYRMTILG
jgi:putative transposase